MEHWTIEDYKKYQEKTARKSKYGAIKTQIDGITFDSKKEADYYAELKLQVLTYGHFFMGTFLEL